MHVGAVAGDDRRAIGTPVSGLYLASANADTMAAVVCGLSGSCGWNADAPPVVLHDHRLDAARRLRVDDVQVGQVAESEQRAAAVGARGIGRAPQHVEPRDVGLARPGGERR